MKMVKNTVFKSVHIKPITILLFYFVTILKSRKSLEDRLSRNSVVQHNMASYQGIKLTRRLEPSVAFVHHKFASQCVLHNVSKLF